MEEQLLKIIGNKVFLRLIYSEAFKSEVLPLPLGETFTFEEDVVAFQVFFREASMSFSEVVSSINSVAYKTTFVFINATELEEEDDRIWIEDCKGERRSVSKSTDYAIFDFAERKLKIDFHLRVRVFPM